MEAGPVVMHPRMPGGVCSHGPAEAVSIPFSVSPGPLGEGNGLPLPGLFATNEQEV